MKKVYTVLFILIVNAALAQTNVSGFINANTTWTLAGSPYHVIGNAILSHGYTLTIQPGVVVKFDTLKTIQIDGELIAIGTPQNRIVFTANSSTPVRGSWGKIQFSDTAVDAQFDAAGNYLSGCIMKYCDVNYSGPTTNYGAISIANASVYISNCRVSYSSYNGILASPGFAKVDSSTVSYCSNVGISVHGIAPYCPYILEYDSLISNAEGGAGGGFNFSNLTCNGYPIIVRNCYFDSNGDTNSAGAATLSFGSDPTLVRENRFVNNMYGDLTGGCVRSATTIECNEFIGNHAQWGGRVINGLFMGNDTIRNNYFEGNYSSQTDYSNCVLYFDKQDGDRTTVKNNTFKNNSSPGGNTIYMGGMANATDISTFYINNNTFINEQAVANLYTYLSSADYHLELAHISNNNFLSPGVLAIANHAAYGGPTIDADSNYWNSTSTQHVDSAIYDYFDNSNSSVVYYSPILTSAVEIDTICPATATSITQIESIKNGFLIYPNPAHNQFTVKSSEYLDRIIVYDITGREVHEQKIHSQLSTVNCPLSTGLYLVRVEAGEKVWQQKVVIE